MVQAVLLLWRDIPAQVTRGKGRGAERHLLPDRFEFAIGRSAMKAGLAGTDAYLTQWRREVVEVEDAAGFAAQLAAQYDVPRLKEFIANLGWNPDAAASRPGPGQPASARPASTQPAARPAHRPSDPARAASGPTDSAED